MLGQVGMPPAPAVMAILDRFNRDEIGHTIEVLVALLDVWDGDPDAEPNGDERDAAWIEWDTMRGSQKRGPNIATDHEDTEDDDPGEEDDHGGCEHDGREPESGDLVMAYGVDQTQPLGCNVFRAGLEPVPDFECSPVGVP